MSHLQMTYGTACCLVPQQTRFVPRFFFRLWIFGEELLVVTHRTVDP